ncbi:MAG: SDR family NAD(P)-dependent oxidoreductase [Verrucomicrobiota bacterium]|jgi:3-oxoacyl-[acyl-carrier protein] reductase
MKQHIILITGANGNLGRAIARAFLEELQDNVVWLGVHRRREHADELAAVNPNRCRVISLDVTRPESWQAAVEEISAAHQRLDVLVNNAGTHDDAFLAQMKPESWREVLAVNLDGVFHGCRAVLPAMISQHGGRIINISSLSALLAPAGQTNYAAAKGGVVSLTQSLAKEVARIGITVNAICPGYLETEMLVTMDDAARQRALAQIPMRRFGKPEEVAVAVRFLACAEAAYITGSVLKIDGGIF